MYILGHIIFHEHDDHFINLTDDGGRYSRNVIYEEFAEYEKKR